MHGMVINRICRQIYQIRNRFTCSDTSSILSDGCYWSTKLAASRSYATSAKFDLPSLDKKWQKIWEIQKQADRPVRTRAPFSAASVGLSDDTVEEQPSRGDSVVEGQSAIGKKMYILPMFPYPSGNLHLGHFRNYTIPDVLARFRRMQGYNVILPMGWDAFGLPAENAAIERGIEPSVWTMGNITKMKLQLRAMNGSWDWSREFATCDPNYYKHTQHIFLLLHKHGLAYQAESLVNYDPIDKTVLANEQVDDNGCSWRSGVKVEKKLLKQWFLRISAYRDALLDDLRLLNREREWPERVISMQKNWLGKSEGARIKFQVLAYAGAKYEAIEVFTTRPDTLFGVQYVALAATHPLVIEKSKEDAQLRSFLENMPKLPQGSKDCFLLQDVRAINPLAFDPLTPDATKASLPIFVTPYVLGDYGDGAVMGVPGHDIRDNAFWKQNRGEDPIRIVIKEASPSNDLKDQELFVDQGFLTSKSGKFEGQSSTAASRNIIEMLRLNELGHFAETWRLRDWLISRQRYWGTPIPIIHCESCGAVPVPTEDLPVELPPVEEHWGHGKAGNPLEHAHDWISTSCPKCHSPAKRDTDTMDTFVDSSWYFMRFADPHNDKFPFSADAANELLPVDLYIGGVEHAILHLLYARFVSKFLVTAGFWPAGTSNDIHGEPFKRLLTQGMVHGKTYTEPGSGRFLKPEEVLLEIPSRPVIIATGKVPNVSFEKMSKSKYNGVDPTTCINAYGADATRAHVLFQAPASEILEWDEAKIAGVTRWMTKIYDYTSRNRLLSMPSVDDTPESYFMTRRQSSNYLNKKQSLIWDKEIELWLSVQNTIISVNKSFNSASSLNTVVSDLMTLSNTLIESERACNGMLRYHALSALLRMMAPITPAFAEECWSLLHEKSSSILKQPFPSPDNTAKWLQQQCKNQICAVQINGKLKVAVSIPFAPHSLEGQDLASWMTDKILDTEEGRQRLCLNEQTDVKKAKRVIVVKGGKTVNFVM